MEERRKLGPRIRAAILLAALLASLSGLAESTPKREVICRGHAPGDLECSDRFVTDGFGLSIGRTFGGDKSLTYLGLYELEIVGPYGRFHNVCLAASPEHECFIDEYGGSFGPNEKVTVRTRFPGAGQYAIRVSSIPMQVIE